MSQVTTSRPSPKPSSFPMTGSPQNHSSAELDPGSQNRRLYRELPGPSLFRGFPARQARGKPAYTEEIVSREVAVATMRATSADVQLLERLRLGRAAVSPTEKPNFIARYGEDNSYRSHKFYATDDKDNFSRIRSAMLAALPMPRRYVGKIPRPKERAGISAMARG